MKKFFTTILLIPFLHACADEGVCKKGGDPCVCEAADACDLTCNGGECSFESSGQVDSTFDCASGDCDITVSGQGDANVDCSGGGCTANVSGEGDLSMSCSGGGCSVTCDGSGDCKITECADCTCVESSEGTCDVSG